MKHRAALVVLGLIHLGWAAAAQTAPQKPLSLVQALSRYLPNAPVVAVDRTYPFFRVNEDWSQIVVPRLEKTGPLPQRLETFRKTYDRTEFADGGFEDLAVRRAGKAWVIASARVPEAFTNASQKDVLDGLTFTPVFALALLSLSPEEMRATGTEEGLPLSRCSAAARGLLIRALHFSGSGTKKMVKAAVGDAMDFAHFQEPEFDEKPVPTDLKRLRLRVRLHAAEAYIPEENGSTSGYTSGVELEKWFGGAWHIDISEVGCIKFHPGWNSEEDPNISPLPSTETPKPSDLDPTTMMQPFGASGILTVADVLKQAGRVTRKRFAAWTPYQRLPVYVGRADLPTGDVLEATRVSLNGAFRRLGDAYILAWDRRGILTVGMARAEASRPLETKRTLLPRAIASSRNWDVLASSVPSDPGDPLALTPAQLAKLFNDHQPPGIPFSDLTPAQQAALMKAWPPPATQGAEGTMEGTPIPASEPPAHPDIRQARISGFRFACALYVPGTGWAELPMESTFGDAGEIETNGIMYAPIWDVRYAGERRVQAGPAVQPPAPSTRPMTLPGERQGAALPLLPERRLRAVAAEMKRRGVDELLYPALVDGYATFRGHSFPRHPDLRENASLEQAADIAKESGLKLVPFVSVLAWGDCTVKAHWLRQHPDWIDVDPHGRSRAEWLHLHPEGVTASYVAGLMPGAIVRASEPAVGAILKKAVSEIAALPGTGGIAFLDWTSAPDVRLTSRTPWGFGPGDVMAPPLGYSVVDRVAAFQRTGVDPVDVPRYGMNLPYRLLAVPGSVSLEALSAANSNSWVPSKPLPAEAALVTALVHHARSVRRDWTVYAGATDAGPLAEASRKGDLPDVVFGAQQPIDDVGLGYWIVVQDGNDRSVPLEGEGLPDVPGTVDVPAPRTRHLSTLVQMATRYLSPEMEARIAAEREARMAAEAGMPPRKPAVLTLTIVDFRGAPELIDESLAVLKEQDAPKKGD